MAEKIDRRINADWIVLDRLIATEYTERVPLREEGDK
jgi:hypothetical protein